MADKTPIGKIAHYFTKIGVAVIDLSGTLKVGDTISIEGANDNVTQKVDSMQIDRKDIPEAKAGQSIGMKTADRVHEGSQVFKITE